MKTVGIAGLGSVGTVVARWISEMKLAYTTHIYDPPKRLGSLSQLDVATVVFICLPTEFSHFQDEYIDIQYILGEFSNSKLIVLKSSVVPGTTRKLQQQFPQHTIVHSPEFLRELHAWSDYSSPEFHIFGTVSDAVSIEPILDLIPAAPLIKVSSAESVELYKYMENSFLALRVVFANEFFNISEKIGVPFRHVRELAAMDQRIGDYHFNVLQDGYRGFSGKCLPKDIAIIIEYAKRLDVDIEIMQTALAINQKLVDSQDSCESPEVR